MIRIAAFALTALTTLATASERPDLLCGGVEPSWSLEIARESALFTAPDSADIHYTIPLITPADGRPWPRALTLLAPQDTAIALIRPQTCSDTMSDRRYEWTVDVLTQRRSEAILLTGCCRAK
ncbi:MAG: hypothetical protein ACPGVA_06090 [Pikeienuella sp.]